jgi:tetratricopeptide (TPR) repeat protein
MKYSGNYILYPLNRALERAVADSLHLSGEEVTAAAMPDTQVTVADIFLYTRGSYELHQFSTKILEPAQAAFESALASESDSLVRATRLNNLGNVLAARAQIRKDADLYRQSIASFEKALELVSQNASPSAWAETQANLGTALQALGRQETNAKLLNKSVDAYTAALLVYSRNETPEQWLLVMHQLGAALHSYGLLLKGNRTLNKAVVAYKNALSLLDADNYAFELAATHNNRGAVLHNLGESEENPERIKEAIHSYEKALTVSMEQQLPFHLSVIIRVNKATAQNVLVEMTKDAALAQDVADEFELILECFPHALQPLCAKHCEAQLAHARKLAGASAAA